MFFRPDSEDGANLMQTSTQSTSSLSLPSTSICAESATSKESCQTNSVSCINQIKSANKQLTMKNYTLTKKRRM